MKTVAFTSVGEGAKDIATRLSILLLAFNNSYQNIISLSYVSINLAVAA
jgi:hypothetical protein